MTHDSQHLEPDDPPFLYISTTRFIVLSLLSMSLYEAYWIYKNWSYLKKRYDMRIQPFWRGIFGIFFCNGLLHEIHDDEILNRSHQPDFNPGLLALIWVVMVLAGNIMSQFSSAELSLMAVLMPSFLCLLPVQTYINTAIEEQYPSKEYYGWSSGHIVCIALGILYWMLLLAGLSMEV